MSQGVQRAKRCDNNKNEETNLNINSVKKYFFSLADTQRTQLIMNHKQENAMMKTNRCI